jgi:hypothetical protein
MAEELLYFKAAPYSPQFKDDEKVFVPQDLQEVIGFLVHMDKGLAKASITIHSLIDSYQLKKGKRGEDLNALWLRIETLASALGTRPASLGTKYEAPSVWASIGQMANIIESPGSCSSHGSQDPMT